MAAQSQLYVSELTAKVYRLYLRFWLIKNLSDLAVEVAKAGYLFRFRHQSAIAVQDSTLLAFHLKISQAKTYEMTYTI